MITRTFGNRGGYLHVLDAEVPAASSALQADGFAMVEGVFSAEEVAVLAAELNDLFDSTQPDVRVADAPKDDYVDFRYGAFNHSPAAQAALGHRGVLDVVEPLLGEDCHAISNTAWRNRPFHTRSMSEGHNPWHIDAGPHVPRPADVPWDDRIPYPVFAIGCHILLRDASVDSGPTGFIPRSHTSGRIPPKPDEHGMISYQGAGPAVPLGQAGDVVFFVSDVWHRRMPTGPGDDGRFFLQVHYGRRDIAQRVRPTGVVNHVSEQARERAVTARDKTVIGLHLPGFYDG